MRTMNTHEYEVKLFKAAERSMRYDGKMPFGEWQKMARAKLSELLGLPLECGKCAVEIEYERDGGDHVEYRFVVETEPGYIVPCHLLIPKSASLDKPVGIVMCLSGHGGGMHVALGVARCEKDEAALAEWPHRNMSRRALNEGRAALVIENRSFGECSLEGYGTSCQEAAKIAILNGRTVLGERVWDCMRILDAVSAHFTELSTEGIVATGNSGGGTLTYYLACLDERITYAAPSCAVCTFEESIAAKRHCMCNYIPSIRRYFEMGDFGGLIAPRYIVVAAGEEDPGFYIKGSRDAYAEIERLYTAAGVPERCAFEVDPGGHLNYADHLWKHINSFVKCGKRAES